MRTTEPTGGLAEQVRWIAFDAVGTLIFADPSVAHAYTQVARRHGSRLSEEEIGRRFRSVYRRFEAAADWASNEQRERERWRQIVHAVLDDVEQPDACFQELFDHFAQPASWKCFPDVAATLMTLRQSGYHLAVASNFDGRLDRICNELVELKPIELRIISSQVGHRKPSPRFYAALIEACGCPPDEILMVGDDLANDGQAARQAGLQAWTLCRGEASGAEPSGGEASGGRGSVAGLDELPVRLGLSRPAP